MPIASRLVFSSLWLLGCGQRVAPDAEIPDAPHERFDATFDARADVVRDAMDAVSEDVAVEIPSVDVLIDVVRDRDAAPDPCEPTAPRPERTLRSCSGPNGAPVEHCREVWVCGGPTTIGSTDAWLLDHGVDRRQMADCDVQPVDVYPAYIDAYEVSVARFRAWLRAGSPQPPAGTRVWMANVEPYRGRIEFNLPTHPCERGRVGCVADPSRCTYRETPGENDSLPINCVDRLEAMIAFCWWEGKHLASEALWEAVATNGGTTELPFSRVVAGRPFDPCVFGDVAGCRRSEARPLPIDAFSLGESSAPAGVRGLWGGLSEVVWALPRMRSLRPYACLERGPVPESSWSSAPYALRGRNYVHTGTRARQFDHAATTALVASSEAIGFRCARWVPDPYAP